MLVGSNLLAEFIHRDSRRANQTAQRASGDFAVLDHDDVTAALTPELPAEILKCPDSFATADDRKRWHQT